MGNIQTPTLVILGEQDASDIHAIVELLMKGIPHTRQVRMTDVAHMLNMEKSAEFNRIALEFLRETSDFSKRSDVYME